MSELTREPVPQGEYFETNRFAGLSLGLGVGALVGLVLCLIGAFVSPLQFSFSWMFGFILFFTMCNGCLFWIIVHYATDAEWTVVVRRQLENIAVLLLALAILAIPILLLRHQLFEWTNIPPGQDHVLDSKRQYLNWPFFIFRAVLYFVLLGGMAYLLRRFSVAQDRDGSPRFTIWMRKVSFGGLPIFGLALTFAAFDWLMGLNYRWYSTMWGPYIFAGSVGSSMSLLVLVITALRKAGYLKIVTLEHYHIMGKWMLAFCIFWAYIGFGQYMLYWYANIPEETQFFIVRNTQSWWPLSLLLVFGRFFAPFGILLLRSIKKHPHQLCWVAGWLVFMQALDMYIIVLPALHGTGVRLSIWDLICPLTIGCSLAFVYLRILGRASMFPVRDPRLIESLRLSN
ncbi:MAG: hypothetical protein JO354_11620 [Verrucomicrobia bacterium]|nr:hypothetical protein [Verrucomicrobiota bacterium]